MTLDYGKKGKVIMSMFDYIKMILREPDKSNNVFIGVAITLGTSNLFQKWWFLCGTSRRRLIGCIVFISGKVVVSI